MNNAEMCLSISPNIKMLILFLLDLIKLILILAFMHVIWNKSPGITYDFINIAGFKVALNTKMKVLIFHFYNYLTIY